MVKVSNLIPILAIALVVLLGAVAVGFIAISGLVASDPVPEPKPSRTATVPTAIPADIPASPSSGAQATVPTPQSEREQPLVVDRSTALASANRDESTVHTYRDGDRTVRVLLQDSLTVLETAKVAADDVVLHRGLEASIVEKQAQHGANAPPVFRSESGGELMSLPGGVLLALDPTWDESEVRQFFEANGITSGRVSPLEFLPNGFAVETASGFSSLELANTLAEKDGVLISSPNWWRETEAN